MFLDGVGCSTSGGDGVGGGGGGGEHNLDLSLGGGGGSSSTRINTGLDFRDNPTMQDQQQFSSSMQLELNWQNQGSRPKVRLLQIIYLFSLDFGAWNLKGGKYKIKIKKIKNRWQI